MKTKPRSAQTELLWLREDCWFDLVSKSHWTLLSTDQIWYKIVMLMTKVFQKNKLIFTFKLLATGQPVFNKNKHISIKRENKFDKESAPIPLKTQIL